MQKASRALHFRDLALPPGTPRPLKPHALRGPRMRNELAMTRTMDDAAGARTLPPPEPPAYCPAGLSQFAPQRRSRHLSGVPVAGTAESRPCRGRHLWSALSGAGRRHSSHQDPWPRSLRGTESRHRPALEALSLSPDLFEYFSMLTGGFPEPFYLWTAPEGALPRAGQSLRRGPR